MDHLHRIEYHRRRPDGALDLEHVEEVTDLGWYIRKGDERRCRYTIECARDFMARAGTKEGLCAISVWRDKERVCTVAVDWRPLKG
ncbi:hypothetical protein [Lentzea nigeriaca]|uniref:hypothetical protein n=1 Tax=Lentzea nigeriaca TaxID=1128665 RepID=UPI00195A6809|nr:hypothetical protein [Lentzea nigeriaca]MBM7857623.1 hypothetical protein [Lentzea nigeriaca]